MTDTLKVLGQQNPAAGAVTGLYTVPAATSTTVSTVSVCNRSSVATSFRLSVGVAGAADAVSQYICYDMSLNGNDTIFLTIGISLAATDILRCYAGLATLTFTAFGVEIT